MTAPLEALTRRRLGGAVLVLAGLAVAAFVLWPRGGDGESTARAKERLVTVPELGLAFSHPTSWKRAVRQRVIRLNSADRSSVLTFASFAGRRTRDVKATLKRELIKRLDPAKVVRDGPGRLGARTAATFELTGFGSKERVRALVLVESTPYRTYAITLLTPARPSGRRLVEVEGILNSVQLARPVRPKFGR